MPNLSELTDVALDLTSLQSNTKPASVPPVVSTWWKVLQFRPATQRWAHAVLYSLMVIRRRLVSATVVLQTNIGSLLQWGELFSVDGSETVYYARSNPTTTAGAYDGNVTVIKVAGPGAFVSRDSEQIVSAKKTIAAETVVGKNLTVIGQINPIGGTIDCGKYVGTPAFIVAPSSVVASVDSAYAANVTWAGPSGVTVKNHVVEMAEIGPYTGSLPSSTSAETLSWAAVYLADRSATSAQINGLRPGVLYVFRVCTLTITGDRACSDISNTVAVLAYLAT